MRASVGAPAARGRARRELELSGHQLVTLRSVRNVIRCSPWLHRLGMVGGGDRPLSAESFAALCVARFVYLA